MKTVLGRFAKQSLNVTPHAKNIYRAKGLLRTSIQSKRAVKKLHSGSVQDTNYICRSTLGPLTAKSIQLGSVSNTGYSVPPNSDCTIDKSKKKIKLPNRANSRCKPIVVVKYIRHQKQKGIIANAWERLGESVREADAEATKAKPDHSSPILEILIEGWEVWKHALVMLFITAFFFVVYICCFIICAMVGGWVLFKLGELIGSLTG